MPKVCIVVVDLNRDDTSMVVQQIKDAIREYGFLEVMSHGSTSVNLRLDSHDLESIQVIKEALSPFQHLFAESEFAAAGSGDDSPRHRDSLHVPEVRIDMPRILDNGEGVYPVIYQDQWKRYIDHLKNSKPDDENYDPMKIMFGTLTAVAGQVIGGLAANRLSISSSAPALAVELASLLGLSVAMAGMILRGRRKRQVVSALMIKIGAMVIAAAIIFSMGQHLQQGVAWIVGPLAFLIMAVAAAFTYRRLHLLH